MNEVPQFSVYWYNGDPSVGSEYKKIRPCIVVSPVEMNAYLKTVVIVPMTSQVREWPFRVPASVNGIEGDAACDQIRVVDKSRLREQIAQLDTKTATSIQSKLREIYCE